MGFDIILYNKDLEELVFAHHVNLSDEPDELIIISGYLGPAPVKRLNELDFNVTVVGGMYTGGMNSKIWETLLKCKENNPKLNIMFSKEEIHAKAYVWKKGNKVLSALIGSANFSSNGLRNDYREILADVSRDTFKALIDYFEYIKSNSIEQPSIKESVGQEDIEFTGNEKIDKENLKYTCKLPLYSLRNNQVHEKGGLNWGFSSGHVAEGDGYIALPKEIIKNNLNLFKPFDQNYQSKGGKKRNSDPVEIIWDDGYIMPASFEGAQNIDGLTYPKQITSYSAKTPRLNGKRISKKSILGRYLRNRIGVPVDYLITMDDLNNYGRTDITLSLIEEGIYYADFSV